MGFFMYKSEAFTMYKSEAFTMYKSEIGMRLVRLLHKSLMINDLRRAGSRKSLIDNTLRKYLVIPW